MNSLHTTAALGPDLPAGWAAAASMAVQATGSPSGTLMFATVADECVPSPVPLHSIYIGYEGQDVHLLLVRSIAKETVQSAVLPFGLHCTIEGKTNGRLGCMSSETAKSVGLLLLPRESRSNLTRACL
jgi:hypothetical protein